MTEFNLSEKRIELIGFEEDEGRDKFQYDEVDVKEFIKLLKEMIPPEECGYGDCIHCRIDKLAGDDLTEMKGGEQDENNK